jgi:hypothetical protein
MARSWQEHPRTMQNLYRIYMSNREGMAQYDKAWRTLATECCPCVLQWFLVIALSESCVEHGFPSLYATFTMCLDAQDVPCLIVFGCIGSASPLRNEKTTWRTLGVYCIEIWMAVSTLFCCPIPPHRSKHTTVVLARNSMKILYRKANYLNIFAQDLRKTLSKHISRKTCARSAQDKASIAQDSGEWNVDDAFKK